MGKKCSYDGCTNEINQWQTYCQQHYQAVMQQQGGLVVEEPPKIPAQRVTVQAKQEAMQVVRQPRPQPIRDIPQTIQVSSNPMPKTSQSDGAEKDKLVRKECLKCAVDLLIATDDLNKPYDELMGQIATLVEDFSKVVQGTWKPKEQ
jgi:hypothetical protein